MRLPVVIAMAMIACSGGAKRPPNPPNPPGDLDPAGPHREAVAVQVKPYLDGEIVSGLVIGLYDTGKLEIYGFGAGPGGKPPTGRTLFDLGTLTRVYTGLLLADAVQRREIELDGAIADLVPPGVTVPTKNDTAITAKHLALHSSGLPRLPPSLLARKMPPDPFAAYGEDLLYQDLIGTQLDAVPGTRIAPSYFGTGLLGFVLGRKIGGGYAAALGKRVLEPLGLSDTFVVTPPAGSAARRVVGTDEDLHPVSRWTWGALAGAGGVVSTARDLLKLVDAELDAASGSKGTLRPAMRLAQEAQLDNTGENEGLGWMIDSAGRFVHEGTSGGFRAYVGLDPKNRRGVVVLASTQSPLVDLLGSTMFEVFEGTAKPPAAAPTPADLARYAGKYNFSGTVLELIAVGNRLYLEGPGEPRHRMVPFGERTFWIDALQSAAKIDVDGDKIKGVVFKVGGKQIAAPRVE